MASASWDIDQQTTRNSFTNTIEMTPYVIYMYIILEQIIENKMNVLSTLLKTIFDL